MKNYVQIFSSALLTCIVLLTFSACNQQAKNAQNTQVATGTSEVDKTLKVAYVNIDSLLTNYEYSKDLQDEFMRQAESHQATINQQGKALESDMAEFQRKVENNAFFDQDRARREQERILKRQQDFQQLSQKLSVEMQEEQLKMNKTLSDTIRTQINLFNKEVGHYNMIFSNAMGDNILYADEVFDITKDVTDFLNSRYTKSKSQDKDKGSKDKAESDKK